MDERRGGISHRLAKLRHASPSIVDGQIINELEDSLLVLFSHGYPQVLTHNDLSWTNILVDETTLEITGIVDWSLAEVLPFGVELYTLSLMTGTMDLHGWHNYTCREKLHSAFWEEFMSKRGTLDGDGVRRKEVCEMARLAARLGAVLHFAFQRNPDDSPSEDVATSKGLLMFLPVLLGD